MYYLQNIIKEHKLFKNLQFWEKSLDSSLKKEINRVKKIRNENEDNNKPSGNENKIIEDDIEIYNDIAFGQIVSAVNSMIDFDINKEYIKQIIEPKIVEYKLNENHKLNINLVMDNKEEPIKKENENNNIEEIKENKINNEQKKEKNEDNINIIKNEENNKSVEDKDTNNFESKTEEN